MHWQTDWVFNYKLFEHMSKAFSNCVNDYMHFSNIEKLNDYTIGTLIENNSLKIDIKDSFI